MIPTSEYMQGVCCDWQRRLRLDDWAVWVSIKRQHQFRKKDRQGECKWDLWKKEAWINILDPQDYPDDAPGPQDMERTLVHELLHLHLAAWQPEPETLEDIMQEQAIHAISAALVGLRRHETVI
jgi:hypothetical protein